MVVSIKIKTENDYDEKLKYLLFNTGLSDYIVYKMYKQYKLEQSFPTFLTHRDLFRMNYYGRATYRSTIKPYPMPYN